jgi:AbrB family looped-hinge helix DNA binding protein
MTFNTTLTQKGQVTIPVSIRRQLKLAPGESVRFRVSKKGQVVVEKNDWKVRFRKLQEQVANHLKKHQIPSVSDEKLDDLINEAAQAAALKHAGPFQQK